MPPSPPGSELAGLLPPDRAHLAAELPEGSAAALAAALPGVRRRLSARGLDAWLAGAGTLHRLGRGEAVVLAWIEAAPQVARDLGEDVLADLAAASAGFAARTSGAVIARILETAPLAARRLGDAALFLGYLRLLEHLLGRAPRALRPMLEHLGALLDVLTLGGLRRWADFGVAAHRTDPAGLERYFAVATDDSRAVLGRERRGTRLVDVQRRLGLYLRALWGRDFVVVPTAGDLETRAGLRPFAEHGALHLPDALDDWRAEPGLALYRAQAAHLAAHLASLDRAHRCDGLDALQSVAVGLIEDARAEALAMARLPRLRALWEPFHAATAAGIAGRFDRVARALLTGAAEDGPSTWALGAFAAIDLRDRDAAFRLGLVLADRLRGEPHAAGSDGPSCPYRCDNRILWAFDGLGAGADAAAPAQVRRRVSVMEMVNAVEVETAGEDAAEVWVQAARLLDDDGASVTARLGGEPVSPPVLYDEYDHRIAAMRPAWATVRERRARPGDPAAAAAILARHCAVTDRLRRRLEAMRPQGVQRLRRRVDGDDLDLDAAVGAAVDLRMRRQPDPRVMLRRRPERRDTAVLVLLDLSESTNDPTAGGETVLALTRAACLLLAEAVHRVGDRFAVHGFCSDGRSQVYYTRFKDFGDPWGEPARARIMGAEGRLSTRMGAAIRHATHHLGGIAAARRLLLVLTDGEPADIDVPDPQHLPADARHAVEAAVRAGIVPFCLALDPGADAYAQRIFGTRNVQVLDRVERLPERLPGLYAALAR